MTPSEIANIESALGVVLPQPYKFALETHALVGEWDDHPEFITDSAVLIGENKHFKMNPEDLSEVRGSGLTGAIKFFLFYGSGKRIREARRKWYKKWTKGGRFIIGSDLGEEQYFIVLSENVAQVYCYELETMRSRVVASSPQEWLLQVGRSKLEAESET